jgi:molybdopterin synthase sulfur carrier subunit
MIYIKYFAKYREWMGLSEQVMDANPTNLAELKLLIREMNVNSLKVLDDPRCIVAVNREVAQGDLTLLKSGDEVAFFPPVTGG